MNVVSIGSSLSNAAFVGAMVGFAMIAVASALMFFAPVHSQTFRKRLKVCLGGVVVLVVSVGLMGFGAVMSVSGLASAPLP